MICPKCKAEYRDGFYVCSDCGITLIAELPRERQTESEPEQDYLEVASIQNFIQLSLVKMSFEAENIRHFILGEQMIVAGLTQGGGPARLFVAADDKERAVTLLDSMVFE